MNIYFLIIFILTFLDLIAISIIDTKHGIIPNTCVVILIVLALIWLFIDKTDVIIFLPFVMFGIALLIQVIFFVVFGEDAIGGGDIKMLSVSMLFIHNINEMFIYFVSLSIFSLIGVIYVKLRHTDSHLRYGPYMSLGLLGQLVYFDIGTSHLLSVTMTFVFILVLINSIFYYRKDVIDYAEKKFFEKVNK